MLEEKDAVAMSVIQLGEEIRAISIIQITNHKNGVWKTGLKIGLPISAQKVRQVVQKDPLALGDAPDTPLVRMDAEGLPCTNDLRDQNL